MEFKKNVFFFCFKSECQPIEPGDVLPIECVKLNEAKTLRKTNIFQYLLQTPNSEFFRPNFRRMNIFPKNYFMQTNIALASQLYLFLRAQPKLNWLQINYL